MMNQWSQYGHLLKLAFLTRDERIISNKSVLTNRSTLGVSPLALCCHCFNDKLNELVRRPNRDGKLTAEIG